ncbi:MAG: META domain-containing protein [Anaerolineae bacterium]
MGERKGLFSGRSRLLSSSPSLLVSFSLILIPLIALAIVSRGPGELMTSRDAASLPAQLEPSPHQVCFACDDEACRLLEAPGGAIPETGSGVFWDGSLDLTLAFEEAYLGGSMTCNLYGGGPDSGKYTTTDDGALKIHQIAVTVQLCSEPEGIMEQEAAYIEALRAAVAYRIIDGRLEIMDADGETTLVFEPEE